METVDVTVDLREPEELMDAVEAYREVDSMQIDTMDSADIAIEGVGFERKTPSDFASSMTDRDDHLKDQVERMDEEYERSFVLVEGNMTDFEELTNTQVKPESLYGFAASIEVRYNTPVVFCSDMDHLVDAAVRRARKHIEEDSGADIRIKSSAEHTQPFEKRVYGCIEGVGAATAGLLYEAFPRLSDALSAGVDDFMQIDGIGEVRAETIVDTLEGDTVIESEI
jgi:ERCC4-type nuclease